MRLYMVRRSLTQCEQCVLVPDELGYGPLPVLLPVTQPAACLCVHIKQRWTSEQHWQKLSADRTDVLADCIQSVSTLIEDLVSLGT